MKNTCTTHQIHINVKFRTLTHANCGENFAALRTKADHWDPSENFHHAKSAGRFCKRIFLHDIIWCPHFIAKDDDFLPHSCLSCLCTVHWVHCAIVLREISLGNWCSAKYRLRKSQEFISIRICMMLWPRNVVSLSPQFRLILLGRAYEAARAT